VYVYGCECVCASVHHFHPMHIRSSGYINPASLEPIRKLINWTLDSVKHILKAAHSLPQNLVLSQSPSDNTVSWLNYMLTAFPFCTTPPKVNICDQICKKGPHSAFRNIRTSKKRISQYYAQSISNNGVLWRRRRCQNGTEIVSQDCTNRELQGRVHGILWLQGVFWKMALLWNGRSFRLLVCDGIS